MRAEHLLFDNREVAAAIAADRRRHPTRIVCVALFLLLQLAGAPTWAATINVTDCGNGEATPGTLRHALRVQAVSADIVDLSTAPCSTLPIIGAIVVPAALTTITVRGPTDRELVVDGGGANTLLVKLGAATTLRLEHLTIANGFWASTDNGGGGCIFSQ